MTPRGSKPGSPTGGLSQSSSQASLIRVPSIPKPQSKPAEQPAEPAKQEAPAPAAPAPQEPAAVPVAPAPAAQPQPAADADAFIAAAAKVEPKAQPAAKPAAKQVRGGGRGQRRCLSLAGCHAAPGGRTVRPGAGTPSFDQVVTNHPCTLLTSQPQAEAPKARGNGLIRAAFAAALVAAAAGAAIALTGSAAPKPAAQPAQQQGKKASAWRK